MSSVVLDHVSLRVRDLGASSSFYKAALAPLGFRVLYRDAGGYSFGLEGTDRGADDFWILQGDAPTTGVHVAFVARDRAAVEAFYRAALRAGGQDNGAPGFRPEYHEGYYGAFVFDPDGNNVEAVYHER